MKRLGRKEWEKGDEKEKGEEGKGKARKGWKRREGRKEGRKEEGTRLHHCSYTTQSTHTEINTQRTLLKCA
jgi:hypothetical protein